MCLNPADTDTDSTDVRIVEGEISLTLPPGTNPPLRLLSVFNTVHPGVMPAYIVQASGREMWVAAVEDAESFTIHAPDLDHRTQFTWRTARRKQTVLRRPLPSWARYPAGVVVNLCQNGMDLDGLSAVVVGGEALGPRYDYSLGVAFATLWHEIHEREYDPDALIAIVERVRTEYIEA
jgi:hypothetical protein